MDYSFFDFLRLIGSLGLFLYGMKIMSEGLQKFAGDSLRKILTAMTTNRVTGVLTGVLITALIQSSSATTVMVVSFVNAGLLTLTQSIGVIMGANIGTTVTAWLISALGFKVDIAAFSLPLLAFGIPLLFSGKSSRKSIGEFIFGFAFLFMGLQSLKANAPDLGANPDMLAFVQNYTDMGFISIILFLFIGAILTMIVQASAATMAITLIMCANGWIDYQLGVALVLGENIGTTITANLAALTGNIQARRAALAHLVFNIFGVCWVLVLFYPFTNAVSWFVTNIMGISDPAVAVSFKLAAFHTAFNISNTFIMIWFVNLIEKTVRALIKGKKEEEEEYRLRYITGGMLSTAELSILQAHKEITLFAERTGRMLGMVKELFYEKNEEAFLKTYSRIEKYESISDRMEIEIANYLTCVAEGRLSSEGKEEIRIMLRAVSEIESIADSCNNMARSIKRRNEFKSTFTDEQNHNVDQMLALTEKALYRMIEILKKTELVRDDVNPSYNIENEINNYRNQLKNHNVEDINNKKYQYQDGVYYMDIIGEAEKLGDYVLNVVQAVIEKKI
ncbi:Na/Pi cotransporter family protein [Parabacteroides acidifaciens]|uniref:Na/Pi cotransporter family protein n=1 Tax=Parabacteroides acidifaciens TaxID=2290935 RepID=A0A3D8HAJ6_9BACT|nr:MULTISPECIES: Na/Pi cotransporter family protein [Parabacteroides]MBC8603251.1 Na/Pi cotransporter family protein [Parabacteroides acidifaciens]RDU48016.1 Na/Pi cotransporter family protein [Parabacteroides acidifaciens]RHO67447.1 Na/Pi cotransporter family protein [Parabacteroides sp. AF48-14]